MMNVLSTITAISSAAFYLSSLAVMADSDVAQSSNFILSEKGVINAASQQRIIPMGEQVDLRQLGRSIPLQADLAMRYQRGDEERLYIEIQLGESRVTVDMDESGRVSRLSSKTRGVSYQNSVFVGDRLQNFSGRHAYCNTYREDQLDYCTPSRDSSVQLFLVHDGQCRLPIDSSGMMTIPACAEIGEIVIIKPDAFVGPRQ